MFILLAAASAAVALSGDGLGAGGGAAATSEVVVTLKAPALSAFGRSLQSGSNAAYLRRVEAAQSVLARRIEDEIPTARVRWRYRLVANGMAVVVPRTQVARLARVSGVAAVWPNVRYHSLASRDGVEQIGADKLWGPNFETAGNGMKIGIIDDGLQATHPYFDPSGFQYPSGFPKGQLKYTTPKVIVQRTFAPPAPKWKYATAPFDPTESFHATHVAGIAAGDHGANADGTTISGVAPNAYLGNYKALTIPTPGFGLDGNAPEIAAAIEAAVADGMDVINLSLGEPEIEPSRDLVVRAIEGAAAAGVVPVVAAGNDFGEFGNGSVSSPGSAPSAITVAAVTSNNAVAGFSSAGPTPLSLQMKPDVAAPGVGILSSVPVSEGTWGRLSGTSMASPHVAGAAALLKERHPTWTVSQVKSALEQTGDPIASLVTRQGGGVVDLARADNPLVFAAPAGISFGALAPGATATREVALTDAGSGAGVWSVTTTAGVTAPVTVTVPGTLNLTASAARTPGDASGFVTLTRGTDVRRIPYWYLVSAPQLASEPQLTLQRPGVYRSTTKGGRATVSRYAYPTGRDDAYPGPERVYRVTLGTPANAGVVVLKGEAVPHVVFAGHEDRLAGYTGLPLDLNPYRATYGRTVKVAGVVLPARGTYDVVFDTRSGNGGPFTFRYWVDDVTPPRLTARSVRGGIQLTATDAGSGVDWSSLSITVNGKRPHVKPRGNVALVALKKGTYRVVASVSDYQETKNMENVAKILPNTRRLTATLRVR